MKHFNVCLSYNNASARSSSQIYIANKSLRRDFHFNLSKSKNGLFIGITLALPPSAKMYITVIWFFLLWFLLLLLCYYFYYHLLYEHVFGFRCEKGYQFRAPIISRNEMLCTAQIAWCSAILGALLSCSLLHITTDFFFISFSLVDTKMICLLRIHSRNGKIIQWIVYCLYFYETCGHIAREIRWLVDQRRHDCWWPRFFSIMWCCLRCLWQMIAMRPVYFMLWML